MPLTDRSPDLAFDVRGLPVPQGSDGPSALSPAMDLLAAIRGGRQGDDAWVVAFVHPGDPASKARPRFSFRTKRTYTPARTVRAEDALADAFREAFVDEPLVGNVAIAAVFYRPNHQRIDADNLMKLVLDAATKAEVWLDDSQVTAQASVVEFDAAEPRTVIAVGPTVSTLIRGPRVLVCPRCGGDFIAAGRAATRKYCSTGCAQPLVMARCARCEMEFRRRASGQRYCSKTCAQRDPLVRQRVALSRPTPTCETCGGRVSRREYRQCANCSSKGRPIGSKNVVPA